MFVPTNSIAHSLLNESAHNIDIINQQPVDEDLIGDRLLT